MADVPVEGGGGGGGGGKRTPSAAYKSPASPLLPADAAKLSEVHLDIGTQPLGESSRGRLPFIVGETPSPPSTAPPPTEAEHRPDTPLDDPDSPPPDASWYELRRDSVLLFLERPIFNALGLLYIFLVIGVGAWFFFMMVGWHTITPEERAQWTLNLSIQCLCGLFNYAAVVTLPWRSANAVHLWCSRRSSEPGLDLYGRPTDAIWFYLARRTRKRLIVAFLLNCVFQYLNQATRIIFPDYESSNSWPGVLWVNIFFGLSFAMGIGAGVGQLLSESRLRSRLPQYFGPGPIQLAREASRLYKQGNSVRSIGSKLRSTITDFHARRELLIAEVASRFSNERSSDRRMSAGVAQGEGSGDSADGGIADEAARRPPVRAATTPSIAWRRALHNSIVGALGEEQQQSALLGKKGSARSVLGKRVLVSPTLGSPLGPARVAASPPAKRNGPSDAATCASELRAASLGGRVSYAPAAERAPATAPVRRPSNVPAGAQPIPDSPRDGHSDGVPREMSRGSSQGSSPPRHRAASLESRMAIIASTVAGGMCTAADRTLEVAGMMGVLPSARARCPTMGAAHMQQQRRGGAAASADEHAGVAAGAGAAYAAAAQESPPLSARSGRTETTNAPTEPSTSSPAAAAPRSASPSGVSTPATASPPATAPASPDAPPTSI